MVHRMDYGQLMVPRRKALLSSLMAKPGQSFREVSRSVGLPSGSANHHLNILCRHEEAWSIGHGSRLRFFAGTRPTPDVADYMARRAGLDAAMEAILAFVQANPGCAQKHVLAAFRAMPHSTVQHVLGRLERERFLTRSWSGRLVRYLATPPPVTTRMGLAVGVGHTLACSFPAMTPHALASSPTEGAA